MLLIGERGAASTYCHIWLVIITDTHGGEFPTQFLDSRNECGFDGIILLKPLDSLAQEFKIHALIIFRV
jgi:hypothetical protein